MAAITVDLREGFFQDEVAIKGAGRELARAASVTTRMQTGLARSLSFEADDLTSITVEVSTRGIVGKVELPSSRPLWVGVSIDESGKLENRVQTEPFGYV